MWRKHLISAAFLVSVASCSDAGTGLSQGDIDRFVKGWPAMAEELAKADTEFDPDMAVALESQLQDLAASDSKDSALDRIAAAAGYDDFESFATVAARIVTATKWAKDPPGEADIKEAVEAVNADSNRTAADKAALISELKTAYAAALKDKPDDADIEAVRPHIASIDEAIGAGP